MKWTILIPALLLAGCGGSGTPQTNSTPFTPPEIANGVYAGVAKDNASNTGDIPMNVTISSGGIIYAIQGYAPVSCPRDWECNADFDGTPAQFQLQKSESGYKGYIYREGFSWHTRVLSAWRQFEVQ